MSDPDLEPAESAGLTIFLAILGDPEASDHTFSVTTPDSDSVDKFRQKVYAAGPTILQRWKPADLVLWKVDVPIASEEVDERLAAIAADPNDDKTAALAADQKLQEAATKMITTKKLSYYFPSTPTDDSVHVIVRPPELSVSRPVPMRLPPTPICDLEEIKKITTDIQSSLEADFNTFLHGNVELPLWEPQTCSEETRTHIAGLRIPKTSESSQVPCLLLHNLGQLSHDAQLANRVDRLFAPSSNPKSLFNTSGAGKTRSIFEGLTGRWGLYLTARTQPEAIGSLDLEYALERLKHPGRLIRLPKEDPDAALDFNRNLTSRHLRRVIYVRVFVFRVFLECTSATPNGITEDHKRRWLLLQLAPQTLLGKPDVFNTLNRSFYSASLDYLETEIQAELSKIDTLLPGRSPKLFCVLDEAQVPASQLLEYFLSDAGRVARPVLRQIIGEWKQFFPDLIISGTGVSMQEMETVMSSVVAKLGPEPETLTDVGAFNNEGEQRAYLESYLPQGYLDSKEGKVVASRVGYWLHGRHRFTATYITRLMQAGFEAPNTVLNQFVEDMTGLRPSDHLDDGPLTSQQQWLGTFNFAKLKKDEALLRQIAGCIFEYIFNGKPRDLGGPADQKLVEYGVARFGNSEEIKADEPLALLAATSYFNKETEWSWRHFLVDGISNANESARGIAFEQVGAYLLGLAFSSPTPLSAVFQFFGDDQLKDESAQLVAIHKSDKKFVCSPVDIRSAASTPTYILGCSPRTSEETLSWIEDPNRVVFCFPGTGVGPDLFLVLGLSDGTVIRVVVQFKHTKTMEPAETETALHSTDPNHFTSQRTQTSASAAPSRRQKVKKKKKRNANQYIIPNPALNRTLQDALGDLGTGAEDAGVLNVLRVLISHPNAPDGDTLIRLADEDRSHHPVATADLLSIAKDLAEEKIINSLGLRMKAGPCNVLQQNRIPDNNLEGPSNTRASKRRRMSAE